MALLRFAFDSDYSEFVKQIVDEYENFIEMLFKPISPVVDVSVSAFRILFYYDLNPVFYWKYIFLTMGVYFFSRAKGAIRLNRFGTAVFRVIWGTIISFFGD